MLEAAELAHYYLVKMELVVSGYISFKVVFSRWR
jgi:hypothetical protein